MSLTDFFVANADELSQAFPNWLAVADEPTNREMKNPFTGESQIVQDWEPKHRPVETVNPEDCIPNYQNLPHADLKRIDTVMLATLEELISDVSYDEASEQFDRPALIDPLESNESGLFELSNSFISSLVGLSSAELTNVAEKWAMTEEMQLDGSTAAHCEMILQEIVRLAVIANQTGRRMYYCWSL